MKFFNNIIVYCATISVLFMSHGDASAFVLCVGSDGHIELESSLNGDCSSESESNSTPVHDHDEICMEPHDSATHCGQCVDFPFVIGGVDDCHPAVQVTKTVYQLPSTGTIDIGVNWTETSSSFGRSILKSDREPEIIVFIRTVTMLI